MGFSLFFQLKYASPQAFPLGGRWHGEAVTDEGAPPATGGWFRGRRAPTPLSPNSVGAHLCVRPALAFPPGCPRGRACAAGAPLLMAKAGGKPPGAFAPGPRGLWRRRAVQDRHKPKWRPTRPIVGTSYGSFAFAQAQKLTPSAVPPLPTEPALARWASVGAPAGVVPGAAAPWAARVDYPASHETGCAVPAWPAGPPRRHASEEPRRSSPRPGSLPEGAVSEAD